MRAGVMRRRRINHTRVIGVVAVAAIIAGSVGAHGAQTPQPNTGSAESVLTLPTLTVTDATGVVRTIALGRVSASATTVDQVLGRLGLDGVNILGATPSGWSVDTSAGDRTGDYTLPVNTTPASGSVTLAGYDVSKTADAATSGLGALSGSLAMGALGATATLGQHGWQAAAGADSSSSTLTLDSVGTAIHLGDLLPADVLSALPLSQLIALAQSLQVQLPAGVTSTLDQLTTLTGLLDQVDTTAQQLAGAQQQLTALLNTLPGTQAAQQTLTSAQQQLSLAVAQLAAAQQQLSQDQSAALSLQNQVTAATALVASDQAALAAATAQVSSLQAQLASDPLSLLLQQQLAAAQAAEAQAQQQLPSAQAQLATLQAQLAAATATVSTDQATVASLQQTVSSDQAAVDAAQTALNTLVAALAAANQAVATAQQAVDGLTTTLTTLLSSATSLIQALPDLRALLSQLLQLVTSAPLVDLGHVVTSLSASADGKGGAGSITCAVSGASVTTSSLPGGTCDQLRAAFATATSTLQAALAGLPAASTVPMPVLDGLVTSTSGGSLGATDTVAQASAVVTPLHLSLPSISLKAVTDSVVSGIDGTVSQLNTLLAGLGLPAATAALTGALGTLSVDVGSLPTGSALANLRTLGVDLTLGGVSTAVLHNRALPAGTPAGPSNPGSVDPGGVTPGTTSASPTPSPAPSPASSPPTAPPTRTTQTSAGLPFTGSDSMTDLAVAVILLLAGSHLLLLGRRRRQLCSGTLQAPSRAF